VAPPPKLVIASRNDHKIREIQQIFVGVAVTWVTHREATWPDVEETGDTYLANALLKARTVLDATGLPALADDSGIEVDALGGAPGVRSARFAGEHATDAQNLQLLLDRLQGVPEAERTARYRCVAVCAFPGGDTITAEGTCEGRVIEQPRGRGGFGYDPAFVPAGETRTMAELGPEEKDAISHRGRAFRALRERLVERPSMLWLPMEEDPP
jgi:XTP/dITP diphosphohydrolase